MFDVVLPLGPNDIENIDKQISFTKKNVIGHRNIYIITPIQIEIQGCIVIHESIFPFADQIAIYHGKNSRNAWYLQQLIKLYAGFIVPGILDRYLVIDADTFFLNPTHFVNSENQCMYNFGREYHSHYFDHMARLHPDFTRVYELSGICHHMIFETKYINELINRIEEYHNNYFYNVFLNLVSKDHVQKAGASEFEIYFNYMQKYHNDKITIRPLKWKNVFTLDTDSDSDYISYHWFDR